MPLCAPAGTANPCSALRAVMQHAADQHGHIVHPPLSPVQGVRKHGLRGLLGVVGLAQVLGNPGPHPVQAHRILDAVTITR